MNWLKQNWVKIVIDTVILIGIFYFGRNYFVGNITSSPTPTPDTVAHSKAELCKAGTFTSPSSEEINHEIKDKFALYLRTALNNWLSGKYGSATNPKTSYECLHTGLLDGKQCPDGVYYDANYDPDGIFEEGDYDNDLSKINQDYLKSQFIVLEEGPAATGGASILLIFKDKPDKVFYAWVYRYLSEDDKIIGFDLRALEEYDVTKNGAPSLAETQDMFINQLCNDNFGI